MSELLVAETAELPLKTLFKRLGDLIAEEAAMIACPGPVGGGSKK